MKRFFKEAMHFIADIGANVKGAFIAFDTGFENPRASANVVILVGGYDLSVYHIALRRKKKLEDAGLNVFVFHPGSTFNKGVDELAGQLKQFTEKVCKASHVSSVALVAHSMGGLVSQYYLEKMGGDRRVRKIITSATPFNGTIVAFLGVHTKAARQMIPNSKLLLSLHNHPKFSNRIVSIRGIRDQFIKPKTSPILEGAKNIEVDVVGHNSLIRSDEVFDIIKKELT